MRKVLFIFSMFALCSGAGYADPIGPDCGSCFGVTYTLENLGVVSSNGNTIYDILLTVDPAGYDGAGAFLAAVAVKVSSTAAEAALVGAPGDPTDWNLFVNTGLNAGGCTGGGNGFVCAQNTGLALDAPFAGTYAWEFHIAVPTGTLFTGAFDASVKALYVDAAGKQAGITSEPITLQGGDPGPTPVPEPSTMLLLGAGLVALAGSRFLKK